MDTSNLLTGSKKRNKKHNASSTRIAQNLPSSGQNVNPQLFGKHNEELDTNGGTEDISEKTGSMVLGKRKRKRNPMVAVEELPAELDFFGSGEGVAIGNVKKQKKAPLAKDDLDKSSKTNRHENGDTSGPEEEDWDEDKCKRVLRSHKIKITVLAESDTLTSGKKKKSKSQNEGENGMESSKHKRMLWPRPLWSFLELRSRHSISKRLAENIAQQGYKIPTEVQLASLPLLMGDAANPSGGQGNDKVGCNLLAVAPTGSGKTLAFLIPVLDSILRERRTDKGTETRALIVAPTRELANQIVNEGRKLAENTGVKISLVRKGMKIGGQLEEPEAMNGHEESEDSNSDEGSDDDSRPDERKKKTTIVKSHILVSTPLALVHALQGPDGRAASLPSVRYLVLDEADVLLDPLFREQTCSIWESCAKADLITTLWSATMGASIEDIALKYIPKHALGNSMPTLRLVVGLKDTALPTLTHTLTYAATEAGKLLALRQLLHPTAPSSSSGRKALRPPFLVFTQTIERAKALHAELRYDIPPEAGGSSRIAALHSEMSETARAKVMTLFRQGEIWIIITTDLLARGVDFKGLNGVVNYDVPTSAAAYVHRVGRTGRAGREGGVAVTFYTKEDIPFVKPIANVIQASERMNGDGKESSIQQWLLDALPMPSKKMKKEVKMKGIEGRRTGQKGARISTKSGFDKRKGPAKGVGKGDATKAIQAKTVKIDEGEEFGGFSD